MQYRMWLGITLILLFFLLGMYTSVATEQICTPIIDVLQQAGDYAAVGQLDTASTLTVQANKQWKTNRNKLALIADHTPMDEIDGLFEKAKMYAKTGAMQDFSATCAQLTQLVDAICEAHKLTWWNLITVPFGTVQSVNKAANRQKASKTKGLGEYLPLWGRWQKSLIFDG